MTYTIPTVAQLKSKFPRFDPISDGRVAMALMEAVGEVSAAVWRESDYQPGILYFAAHLLQIDGASASSLTGVSLQDRLEQASAISIGPLTAKFSTATGGSGSTSGTTTASSGMSYWQRYLQLRARNMPLVYSLARG